MSSDPRRARTTAPWKPRVARVGEWELVELNDRAMRLDGGSMWGVVPRTMWRELTPPDEDNTIAIAIRPFLARRGGDVVLIEGGLGDRWEPKWRSIYRMEPSASLIESLAACGVEPDDVTHVVASHCHWDHVGALTVERDGELAPTFRRALHFAPASELAMAKAPGTARKASYRADDVVALERRARLQATVGEVEIVAGLRIHELGGHSDGVSVITLESRGERAVFWSDVVPTTHHAQPPYIMAYDIDVVRSFEVRSNWLARAAEVGALGLFYHDVDQAFARIARDGKRYRVEPAG